MKYILNRLLYLIIVISGVSFILFTYLYASSSRYSLLCLDGTCKYSRWFATTNEIYTLSCVIGILAFYIPIFYLFIKTSDDSKSILLDVSSGSREIV